MKIIEEKIEEQRTGNELTGIDARAKVPVYRPIRNSIYPMATLGGLSAGFFMGVYLVALQVFGFDGTIVLKFFKYLILVGILGWGLVRFRQMIPGKTFFQNGILLGVLTTFISGLTLIAINIVVSLLNPEWAFNKFNLAIESPGTFLVTSGAIFFEVLVFGLVGTFIWLQYLKGKRRSDTR
ncbi:MAG: hypothetical protein R3D58_05135 [Saprospiraceae bacterium]|nr:hypothetical protein [Lewinellaceae bacterium]